MADAVKLVYALWGSGLDTALQSTQLHTLLRAAGATRLQINVDDADVEAAMLRITAFDSPVSAVVSVWTADGSKEVVDSISDLLAAISQRSAGWEVEETVRLVPPSVENGVRTTALAQIAFLRIPAELDPADWLEIGRGSTPASPSTPRTRSATCRTGCCGRCTAPSGSTPSSRSCSTWRR